MARENNRGLYHQPQNQADEVDSSDMSFEDLSSSEGSPSEDPSLRFSRPAVHRPVHQGSDSTTMMFRNPRLLAMPREMKRHIDNYVASRLSQLQQNSNQQQQNLHQKLRSPAARRLASHGHYRSNRPPDNNIVYWRSFVKHYYSPQAKKRICFSTYPQSDIHVCNEFPQMETWKCEICGSTSGKGYVETFNDLPRLNKLYFNSGIIDELMYLGRPTEVRHLDGSITVGYEKVVQETIYNTCRVVHEGKLQVIFTPQIQIKSWDFCVRRHDVLLPLRLLGPQITEFVKDAVGCNCNADVKDQDGVMISKLPANGNRVAAAARKLADAVGQRHISDWGLPKHFLRSLQISEVHNAMKDLMGYSIDNNLSPIEALNQFGRKPAADATLQTGCMESRPPMQEAPGPSDPGKIPAQNVQPTGEIGHSAQASNSNKMAMYDTRIHNQKSPMAEQMMPDMYPSPYNKRQTSAEPSSSRVIPNTQKLMLINMLARMQREQPKRARNENTTGGSSHRGEQKKSRAECSQVNNELPATAHSPVLDGMAEKGKGLATSSCSSNSSRIRDGNIRKKGNTDSDDDFTSPAQTQRSWKNNDRPE